jgi:hypothetical protein
LLLAQRLCVLCGCCGRFAARSLAGTDVAKRVFGSDKFGGGCGLRRLRLLRGLLMFGLRLLQLLHLLAQAANLFLFA